MNTNLKFPKSAWQNPNLPLMNMLLSRVVVQEMNHFLPLHTERIPSLRRALETSIKAPKTKIKS
jgi:hypothetical protein